MVQIPKACLNEVNIIFLSEVIMGSLKDNIPVIDNCLKLVLSLDK